MAKFLLYIGFILLFFSVLILDTQWGAQLDVQLIERFRQHRNLTLNHVAIALSWLGTFPVVLFFSICLLGLCIKQQQVASVISVGLLGAVICTWLLKYSIARARPDATYHLVSSYGDSFPSAHSCYAAALSCMLMYLLHQRKYAGLWCSLAVLWMLMMGSSRVYLGVHFPSDVLAGWSISFIWFGVLMLYQSKKHRLIKR